MTRGRAATRTAVAGPLLAVLVGVLGGCGLVDGPPGAGTSGGTASGTASAADSGDAGPSPTSGGAPDAADPPGAGSTSSAATSSAATSSTAASSAASTGGATDKGLAGGGGTSSSASAAAGFVAGTTAVDPATRGMLVTVGDLSRVEFASPSGRILCGMDGAATTGGLRGAVRCDIREATFVPPPQPADCELDHGSSVGMSGDSAADFLCVGDVAVGGAPPPLGYGERVEFGGFVCASAEDGVRCAAADLSHGFRLSRAAYELY